MIKFTVCELCHHDVFIPTLCGQIPAFVGDCLFVCACACVREREMEWVDLQYPVMHGRNCVCV
jgi:hypothetical protein